MTVTMGDNSMPEIRQARIQGSVVIQAVVQKDGTVGRAVVVRLLDRRFGLDTQALNTVPPVDV
jgi:outer membrane biosynthesis protein TonB